MSLEVLRCLKSQVVALDEEILRRSAGKVSRGHTTRGNLGLVFTRLHIRFGTLRRLTDEDIALIARAGC